ncbi:hypothetical protein, partial [Brevibacterium epidermidis]|uniref:hypothetical protein n=1 Tax=Brevibacterium epidermidis TaxID=1698 RepID=UPI001A7E0D89
PSTTAAFIADIIRSFVMMVDEAMRGLNFGWYYLTAAPVPRARLLTPPSGSNWDQKKPWAFSE